MLCYITGKHRYVMKLGMRLAIVAFLRVIMDEAGSRLGRQIFQVAHMNGPCGFEMIEGCGLAIVGFLRVILGGRSLWSSPLIPDRGERFFKWPIRPFCKDTALGIGHCDFSACNISFTDNFLLYLDSHLGSKISKWPIWTDHEVLKRMGILDWLPGDFMCTHEMSQYYVRRCWRPS
ncbi:hypothetical protein BT63DRAFT_176591 [Microthyrium microscopicum]|uniref:Uncharacterized protein n=1 Tax=Microthyrium microscopicum TaxID=703497 RepID=A0A6A6UJJ9_9PEZI|nr:hypothetical protein BT63DRAFT_176591 [Microthyrium microscopicum]